MAPVSWLVQHDVDEGRSKFNVSEWERARQEAEEAAENLQAGEMPRWFYLPLHAEARLDLAGKAGLIGGLNETFGNKRADQD